MIEIIKNLDLDEFRELISELLDIPISRVLPWGKQQDVSNLNFFITVKFNPNASLGFHKQFNAVNETQKIKAQKETTAVIGFHGNNAVVMAEFFQLALNSEQAFHLFGKINCGLLRSSDVNNLTIPFAGGYEERAEIQLVLSHDFIIEHKQNRINSVEIGLVLNQ